MKVFFDPILNKLRVTDTTGGGGGGSSITVVTNYSSLPSVSTVSGQFYWCSQSQGTSWLPGSLGGTYYNSGLYYSNGTSWEFLKVPYQATQLEVDAGIVTDKFVSPATLSNWSSSTAFVPYTGANANVDLGEYELKAGQIELDQSPTGTAGVAVMRWNNTDGTVDLGLKGGNVTLQIGQEQVVRVVNKTATNITLLEANYQAVRVTGAQGQRLKVDLALATNDLLSAETIGLVTETILNNQEGFITTSGLIRDINTTGSLQGETWADGDVVYLSPTIAGNITNVKPIAPNHLIIIGYVIHSHITQGSIFVKVDNGYELNELHNVLINGVANNDVLTYDSASSLWKNKQSNYLQIVSKDITDSAPLTGTTAITLMKSILIPANTYATGDVVKILNRAIRNTATGTAINYFYINTTNTLTGATLIGTQSTAASYYANERNLYIKSTTISETIDVTTTISSDANVSSANANSNLNINWGVNQYIIAAFQNAAVGNSTVMSSLIIQKY
jgi:hypothetical protein